MNRDFWQARWDDGRIGFHQNETNPYLQRHWPRLGISSGATVLVPLCGKSRDMLWLRDQGCTVIGVEIVSRAVEEFFNENGLEASRRKLGEFTLWESGAIKIFQGDFFDLAKNDLAGISAIYDRASLIALPPDMRRRYAAHMHAILPPKTNILLVTLDYHQGEMEGPPFAVSENEVANLYKDYFKIELVCSEEILEFNPRFQEQGLTRLTEKVYVLRTP
jgi:thiopurine S-methyltransferase